MSEPPDPFETLRGLNPVHEEDVRGERFSARAQAALERITSYPRHEARKRRRLPRLPSWTRRKVYLLALVPVAAALAAGAWALTRGAAKQLTVGCYARADLQAHTVVVPADDSPVTSCAITWQHGDFGSATTPPRLQACVLPSGAIGVFPSPQGRACRDLKLPPFAPTGQADAIRLKDELVKKFLANPCMGQNEAIATVQEELRQQRLNAWEVRTTGAFTAARPCASLAFDEARQVVLLVPIPRQ